VCYCLRIIDGDGSDNDGDGNDDDGGDTLADDGRNDADPLKDARRLFVWQGRQKELALELLRSLDGDDADDHVERTLQLSASFVFEKIGERPYSSGLVHFLAVMGIDAEMGRLRTATDYSTVVAGALYCIRAIAVETLLPSARKDEQGDAERDEFLRKRRDFLADGSYSVASEVLSWLAYGKTVGKTTGSSGNTSWSADGRTLYLHERPIELTRFRAIVQDVVAAAESVL
jgi:hypothetical protein